MLSALRLLASVWQNAELRCDPSVIAGISPCRCPSSAPFPSRRPRRPAGRPMFASLFAGKKTQYDLLPTQDGDGGRVPLSFRASRLFKRRGNTLILGFLFMSFIVTTLYLVVPSSKVDAVHNVVSGSSEALPPLYPDYHREELALPQHFVDDPFAGGKKYMWVADHTQCKFPKTWC